MWFNKKSDVGKCIFEDSNVFSIEIGFDKRIGDVKGAVLGGFLLGLSEIMIIAFLPALTGYRDAFAFILLIAILLFKPDGLMGKNIAEKV